MCLCLSRLGLNFIINSNSTVRSICSIHFSLVRPLVEEGLESDHLWCCPTALHRESFHADKLSYLNSSQHTHTHTHSSSDTGTDTPHSILDSDSNNLWLSFWYFNYYFIGSRYSHHQSFFLSFVRSFFLSISIWITKGRIMKTSGLSLLFDSNEFVLLIRLFKCFNNKILMR